MAKTANTLEINHSDVPIRLFKSDFLEFFTHIHPAVVVIIWLPVAAFLHVARDHERAGRRVMGLHPARLRAGHFPLDPGRVHDATAFVFHYDPKGERMQAIFFTFHGVHHAQPQLKTRLVMPPVVSIPAGDCLLLALFSGVRRPAGYAAVGRADLSRASSSAISCYDMIHYATHHFPMRSRAMKYLKRYHMMHHFKTPSARFGVSSPVWDVVFRTKPA